jgi:hypothetical protein
MRAILQWNSKMIAHIPDVILKISQIFCDWRKIRIGWPNACQCIMSKHSRLSAMGYHPRQWYWQRTNITLIQRFHLLMPREPSFVLIHLIMNNAKKIFRILLCSSSSSIVKILPTLLSLDVLWSILKQRCLFFNPFFDLQLQLQENRNVTFGESTWLVNFVIVKALIPHDVKFRLGNQIATFQLRHNFHLVIDLYLCHDSWKSTDNITCPSIASIRKIWY